MKMYNVEPTLIKTYKEFQKDKAVLEQFKYMIVYKNGKKYLCKIIGKECNVAYYEIVSLK